MRFRIHDAILERFPGLRLAVVVGRGADPTRAADAVDAFWRDAWHAGAQAARAHGNPQSHPRVAPWRDAFRAMGVAAREYPSSIEAMLRRAAKTAEPFRLMPLVDWYNAVSLTHQVPVGAFDLGRVRADIDLRPTRPGDRFLALDADAPVEPAPGEVAYATGATVLTRHFVWRQAQEGLIRPDTRDVFVVSEILPAVGDDVAAAVLADLAHGLGAWFGAEVETFALDASRPTAHW